MTYILRCNRCSKEIETKPHTADTPDGWLWIEQDVYLCPDCRKIVMGWIDRKSPLPDENKINIVLVSWKGEHSEGVIPATDKTFEADSSGILLVHIPHVLYPPSTSGLSSERMEQVLKVIGAAVRVGLHLEDEL
jgi:DNA-directed RNA polymerase subunit RPC12/RpoP